MRFAAMSICLFGASLVAASPAVAQSDTEPPALTDFDFNPKSIDVTGAPASVTCQISAQDVLVGVSYVEITFFSPSNSQIVGCGASAPSSGTIHDGVWSCTANVAQYRESGTYRVYSVRLDDGVGNIRVYYTADLATAGFPTQLQVLSNQDILPPTLTSFDFNPKSIDVTGAPASVTCQISAQDVLVGVSYVEITFFSPSNSQIVGCGASAPSSGTIHDGVWSCTANVAQYRESGTYRVYSVRLDDGVGNIRVYYTADLATAGFPTQLQVLSNQDILPPTLTSFDFNPKSIDVTGAPASVTCQISAQDVLVGVSYVEITFFSPSNSQIVGCGASAPSSGTIHDGVWSCTANVAQYRESGTYRVYSVRLDDGVGNIRVYYTQDLAHLDYPTELQVCSDHLGRDTDADGWGNDCDNCPTTYNPNQLDGDADGVGVVCDVCPTDYDPSQTDFDLDGQGDRCDLSDGLIVIFMLDKDYIDWQNEVGPNAWNVYEGDLSVLRTTGAYTQAPFSNTLADRRCHIGLNYTDDFDVPPEAAVQFSLVTGMTGFVEGSLGTNGAGVPRANANPCP